MLGLYFLRRALSRPAWIGILFLAFPASARDYPLPPRGDAIEKPATAPLAGVWIGQAHSPDRSYKILLHHRAGAPMYDGTVSFDLRCVIVEPAGLEDAYCRSTRLSGDATTLEAQMLGEYGKKLKGLFWASSAFGELTLSLGGDSRLSGTWTEASVAFTRLVPRISRAEAAPVRIEDLDYHWRNFRENGGSWRNYQFGFFRVMLTGTDLPRAGFSAGEIVVDDPHFELYRASVAEDGRLQVDFRLHEGVQAGRKHMTLAGGAAAAFDLVIVGLDSAARLAVGNLVFDYSSWHATRAVLQGEVATAFNDVVQLNRIHAEHLDRVAALQADVERLKVSEQARLEELSGALDRKDDVPEQLKDTAYRRYEDRISRNEARMEQIVERLPLAAQEAKEALVAEYRELEALVASDRLAMQQLEVTLGIAEHRAQAEQQVLAAEAAHLQALKDLARGISERNIIANVLSGTLDDYHIAVDRHARAQQDASLLGDTAPLITRVEAPGFEAVVWYPEDDLKALDRQIAESFEAMWYWDAKRREYRTLLPFRYNIVESAANSLIGWQRASIAAQFGIELVFTGSDILLKFRSGGVTAALGEAYKKIIENLYWPPTYLDANNLVPDGHDLLDSLEANAPAAGKALEKRLYKSAITGTATSAAVAAFVRNEAAGGLQEISRQMIRQSWLDGEEAFLHAVKNNFQVRPLFDAQRANLARAEEKLASSTSFKGVLKGASISFVTGLVKDYAKHEAKQAIANIFEGDAFQVYAGAQIDYGAAATLLLRSSNYYWQAADLHAALTAVKREILRQYDPVNAMKINPFGGFPTDADLIISFSNRGSDPHHPNAVEMDVFFGGVPARRLSGQRLIYSVPAFDLRRMPEGRHELRVLVKG